jgi:class 3 adenylate cyclase/tetratricopeptide (TPR) repeat protein
LTHCTQCGGENPPEARFCSACGSELPEYAADPERKQVTALFSDLSGYTALSERLDPEETREIMSAIFADAAEVVGAYGGRIEKFIGDAIMVIFGVPESHEDDPGRAVRAALELHKSVAARAPELRRKVGVDVALHSGINTGVVVTGELHVDGGTAGPLGDTINTAARLMEMAGPGEILVGPETRRAIEAAFELDEIGDEYLKGKAEAIQVARVIGHASKPADRPRRRARFIGRQEEIGVLLGGVERLLDGEGGAVAICGGAGTGKTRLVEELRARVGLDVRWLEGRAYPYAENIPYFLLSNLLNWSWRIRESDSPATVQRKVREGIAALDAQPEALMPVIAKLYGFEIEGAAFIDREAYRERLFHALSRLLAALAEARPTVVCLQDLQWADASSLYLVRRLLAAPPAPVLFVCNYRPGPELGDVAREIILGEFSPRQTRQLVESLLDDEAPPDDLIRFVEGQAGGNPFFVEELVNALVESRTLERRADAWSLRSLPAETTIPSTIRGVIAARIDRLDETSRLVLRRAAVLGREFLPSVLDRLVEREVDVEACLERLVSADLVRPKSGQPEPAYTFKHTLTQEVAYMGLLRAERVALHARAAVAMEAILGDRVPEFVETLAFHFARGGVDAKAVHYLIEAGRKATARYALDEADSHLQQAYEMLVDRPRTADEDRVLIELLLEWILVVFYQNKLAEMLARLQSYESVAAAVDDEELRGMYAGWLGLALFLNDDLEGSLEKLELAHRIGLSSGSDRVVAYANSWKTYTLWFLGREAEALEAADLAKPLAARFPDDHYLYFSGPAAAAGACAAIGDLRSTRSMGESLVEYAGSSGNTRAAVAGYSSISLGLALQYDFDGAVDVARVAKSRAIDPFYRAWATFYEALGLAWAGRVEESRTAVEELQAYGGRFWTTLARPLEGLTLLGEGRLSAGMKLLRQHLDYVTRIRSKWLENFARIMLGRLFTDIVCRESHPTTMTLLRNPGFVFRAVIGARSRARQCLESVIRETDENEVTASLGVAHLNLARLDQHGGDIPGARAHLEQAIAVFEDHGAVRAIEDSEALAGALDLDIPAVRRRL